MAAYGQAQWLVGSPASPNCGTHVPVWPRHPPHWTPTPPLSLRAGGWLNPPTVSLCVKWEYLTGSTKQFSSKIKIVTENCSLISTVSKCQVQVWNDRLKLSDKVWDDTIVFPSSSPGVKCSAEVWFWSEGLWLATLRERPGPGWRDGPCLSSERRRQNGCC